MAAKTRVFLDTSALFAGIWSESGGARLILRLGEVGAVQIVISRQVLRELDDALQRKAPALLPALALLLDRAQVEVTDPGSAQQYDACLALTGHPGDARILADAGQDAGQAGVNYLVSLDQKHILAIPQDNHPFPYEIGTPGDFLGKFRASLGRAFSGNL
jgi:predicted nucleic acid-binding protein